MRMKKVFSIVLIICLIAVLFTGCGKESENTVTIDLEKEQDANSLEEKGSLIDDSNIASLPKFNVEDDKKIKVIAWWIHPKVGDQDMDLWPQEVRLLKKLYDTDVEYIKMPAGEIGTKHAAMVMAGDPADVVHLQNWVDFPYSFTNGLYEPLDEILPLDNEIFKPVKRYIDDLRINGKAYWAVHMVRPSPPNLMYNKTLIEEAGLEDPWELIKRNEWTWDTFYDYCKELTVDKDGDGIIDQYGGAAVRGFINNLPNTLGYPVSKINEDNNIEVNLRDEGLMKYYEFLKKIGPFGENVFHPLSFKQGDAVSKVLEEFVNGNIGLYYTYNDPIDLGNTLRPMLLNDEIGQAMLPRYPDADKQYVSVSLGGLGISKGAKHPQAAAAYISLYAASYFESAKEVIEDNERIANLKEKELGIDLLSLYNGDYDLTKKDIYGALYTQELPQSALDNVARQKYIRILYQKEFPDCLVFDFGQFAGLTNYYAFEKIFCGDENGNPVTAQQVIEEIQPQIQEKIDKFEKALNGE